MTWYGGAVIMNRPETMGLLTMNVREKRNRCQTMNRDFHTPARTLQCEVTFSVIKSIV